MGEAARNKSTAKLRVLDGSSTKEKRIKADGTVDKRYYNTNTRTKGTSSEVYFLDRNEIELVKNRLLYNIENATTPTNELMNRRNYALFCMGINVGLRISDLIKLTWGDIFDKRWDFKDFASLRPKKTERFNKYVTIGFNDSFKTAALEYKNNVTRLRDLPALSDYIFFGKMDYYEPIDEKHAYAIIKKNAIDAGVKKNVGTHSLRKTFGHNFYMEAKDKAYALRMLQEWFKHETPDTTLRYIGCTLDELLNFANSVNL